MNEFVLVKGDSFSAFAFLQPNISLTVAQFRDVQNRNAYLYAYGIVIYKDVFGTSHETRFGYLYFIPLGGDPRPAGFRREELPSAYNRAT
jgi:hypothetical protein